MATLGGLSFLSLTHGRPSCVSQHFWTLQLWSHSPSWTPLPVTPTPSSPSCG